MTTTPSWDPRRYLRFADHRLRPALDLLARIDVPAPTAVHDLGCGTGNVTRLLQRRWPEASVVGSDNSPAMLEEATADDADIEWRLLEASTWDEPQEYDVIFSNAVLHWIPSHDDLIVRLLASLRPGGVLAVQMPLSWYEPSHALMRAVLDQHGFGSPALRRRYATANVAPPEHYTALLGSHAASLDLWTTRYFQVLHGPDPVLEWVSGTGLRPILDALPPAQLAAFLADYSDRLRTAYPQREDGSTLFPFPRLFFVAAAPGQETNRIDAMESEHILVTGQVAAERRLTATDLAAMSGTVDDVAAVAPGAVGTAVPVARLLDDAGTARGATHCTVISAGGDYRASIPLTDLHDGGWLAFALGDGGLPSDKGGPFRLTVARGSTLCWNVKQVATLKVTVGPEPDDVPENPPH